MAKTPAFHALESEIHWISTNVKIAGYRGSNPRQRIHSEHTLGIRTSSKCYAFLELKAKASSNPRQRRHISQAVGSRTLVRICQTQGFDFPNASEDIRQRSLSLFMLVMMRHWLRKHIKLLIIVCLWLRWCPYFISINTYTNCIRKRVHIKLGNSTSTKHV